MGKKPPEYPRQYWNIHYPSGTRSCELGEVDMNIDVPSVTPMGLRVCISQSDVPPASELSIPSISSFKLPTGA